VTEIHRFVTDLVTRVNNKYSTADGYQPVGVDGYQPVGVEVLNSERVPAGRCGRRINLHFTLESGCSCERAPFLLTPQIQYLERHVPLRERMAFYSVSDAVVVTATRDGMIGDECPL
jgi:trehalose-6-phosphate synthase